MKVVLNGKEMKTRDELHNTLKLKLDLPDYYGNNLDALWDCLTGWVDLPLTIKWINFNKSKLYLGEYAEKTRDIFQDAQNELQDFYIEIIN